MPQPTPLNREFVVLNGPRLFRYFRGRFDHALAADLVQETFIRLMHKLDKGDYRPEDGDLISYTYGIAKFVALEGARAERKYLTLHQNEDRQFESRVEHPVVSTNQVADQHSFALLRRAILALSEDEREVMLLLIDRDLTLVQIAAVMAIPLNTVKSHMLRGKQHLKEILAKQNLSKEDFL